MSQFDDPEGAQPPLDPGGGGAAPGLGEPHDAGPWSDLPDETPEHPPAVDASYQVGVPTEQLEKSVVVYWLLSGLMSWLFLAMVIGGGATAAVIQWPEHRLLLIWPVAVFLGLLLLWTAVSPYLAWQRWRFYVDTELLLARYGILFIEEKAIPISRLQHVDLYRGFLERIFGLTTLIVFTAGTEGAHFRLPGLSVTRAQQLRDQILSARGDDVI